MESNDPFFKIKKYIEKIYFLLRLNDVCFVKGAFVIYDPSKKLINDFNKIPRERLAAVMSPLFKSNNAYQYALPIKSHTIFMNKNTNMNEMLEINIIKCNQCRLDISCSDSIFRNITNIKYYIFGTKLEYIYIKLETSPTLTMNHLKKMTLQYGPGSRKIKQEQLSGEITRREECKNNDKCDYHTNDIEIANRFKIDNNNILDINQLEIKEWYNKNHFLISGSNKGEK